MRPRDEADVINRMYIGNRTSIARDDSKTGVRVSTGPMEMEHCGQSEARNVRYTKGPGPGVHRTYGT